MTSLKAFTPFLAQQLVVTPATLYERQRVLIPAGLLKAVKGRGPGTGVRLTGGSVSMLLVSIMASDLLKESGEITGRFARLVPETGKCIVSGRKSLLDALSAVLTSTELAGTFGDLLIERNGIGAVLWDAQNKNGTNFLERNFKQPILGLNTSVRMPKRVLNNIAREMIKALDRNSEERRSR